MKTLIILGALLVQLTFASVSYEGYHVWRVYATGGNGDKLEAVIHQHNLDVWAHHPLHTDILINPKLAHAIDKQLDRIGAPRDVLIENVQTIIDEQEVSRNGHHTTTSFNFEVYHQLDHIYSYLEDLAGNFSFVTLETIGQSIEGNDMQMLKLSTQPNNTNAFWIQCGSHAREWVGPASCLYGLDMLTTNYGTDPDITAFLDDQDLYMVVVVNPDGYSYSWDTDRLWRKSRRINVDSECIGVDLNRNYDINFGGEGASPDPCGELYHGASAFSEPETAALSDAAIEIMVTQNLRTYYDVHAYGQFWLSPWGWTLDLPADADILNTCSLAAVDAIAAIEGTAYTHGPSSNVLFVASGGSIDWAYSQSVTYTFAPELRDTGEFGYLLPEEQIIPTSVELWDGIFAAYDAQV